MGPAGPMGGGNRVEGPSAADMEPFCCSFAARDWGPPKSTPRRELGNSGGMLQADFPNLLRNVLFGPFVGLGFGAETVKDDFPLPCRELNESGFFPLAQADFSQYQSSAPPFLCRCIDSSRRWPGPENTTMWLWWISRSMSAAVSLLSPNTVFHWLNSRLDVMMRLFCS